MHLSSTLFVSSAASLTADKLSREASEGRSSVLIAAEQTNVGRAVFVSSRITRHMGSFLDKCWTKAEEDQHSPVRRVHCGHILPIDLTADSNFRRISAKSSASSWSAREPPERPPSYDS